MRQTGVGTSNRLIAMSAVLAAAVVLGGSAVGCSAPQVGSTATSRPSATVAPAPAATTPVSAPRVERVIPKTQFGSSKAKWHKALASVIVRDDILVVKVTRDVSESEAAQIEAASKAVRDKLSLSVTQYQIQDAYSGYLLKYGSL